VHATGEAKGIQLRSTENQTCTLVAVSLSRRRMLQPRSLTFALSQMALAAAIGRLEECQWPIIEGPVIRTGATGRILSIYVVTLMAT